MLPFQSTMTISAPYEACVLLQLPLHSDAGYDNLYMLYEVQNTALVVTMIWVSYWLKVSRNSHGAEPMRSKTSIQEQQSSIHNSGVKGIQTGLRNKKKQQNNVTTFCKHEA